MDYSCSLFSVPQQFYPWVVLSGVIFIAISLSLVLWIVRLIKNGKKQKPSRLDQL